MFLSVILLIQDMKVIQLALLFCVCVFRSLFIVTAIKILSQENITIYLSILLLENICTISTFLLLQIMLLCAFIYMLFACVCFY